MIDADNIDVKNFNQDLMRVRKKPIITGAIKMKEVFKVTTLEGEVTGKAGDYLMIGKYEDRYPCDKDIFEKTYDVIEKSFSDKFNVKDKNGNRLELRDDKLYLYVLREDRERNIGELTMNGDTLWFIRHFKPKNIINQADGLVGRLGIAHYVLRNLPPGTMVRLDNYVDNIWYEAPIEKVFETSKIGQFKNQGFEVQHFVPLDIMKKY
jgi:hypothetical protein